MSEVKSIQVTLVRSLSGRKKNHQACARGLGLRRMHQSVIVTATPAVSGMVRKIDYLLKVEEVS